MIHQIIELEDLKNHKGRRVNSYMPFFMMDTIEPLGAEVIFDKQGKINHYLIIEQLEGNLFFHDVLKVNDSYYPISTKVKTSHFTIRKNYTGQISALLNHLSVLKWIKTNDEMTPPTLPINSLMNFLKCICMDDETTPIPEDIFMIYEHVFDLYSGSEYSYDTNENITYNWKDSGYIDSANLANKYFSSMQLMYQIRHRLGPKPGKSDKQNVSYVINILNMIALHKVPCEKNLCIWRDLDQIISSIGIYYPCDDFSIANTELSTLDINYETRYVKETRLTLLNFPIKDFLNFCDLFLPMNCQIVYEGNTCKKFQYTDEYFYTYFSHNTTAFQNNLEYNLNLMNVPFTFFGLLGNLLMLLNRKTGLERYQHKIITKLNDNKIKLEMCNHKGVCKKFYWDLSLLHITDPIQYGIY